MTSKIIREKYIGFFEKQGHEKISPSPLVLQDDPTTLFTSSGMQQLVPYLKGKDHPKGKRLVNSQPSLRLQDIEEVGDNRHTTFFEMLGNWSLGDYFKKEQLAWFLEFLTKELSLPKEKLYISVFEGTKNVPKDEESVKVWQSLGIPEERIFYYGVDENWWSRAGSPDEMPEGEIGGPDSEVFYDFGTPHDKKFGKECHPTCECGRFLEIGNSVFIQYTKRKDGSLKELPQKNVDFGGGLERITAATNDNPDIFQIDMFKPLIKDIEERFGIKYGDSEEKDRSFRVIADHLRASVMLIAEGVEPSNKLQGYALRRLLRRSIFHKQKLAMEIGGESFSSIAQSFIKVYPDLKKNWTYAAEILDGEFERFGEALQTGMKNLREVLEKGEKIDGKFVFDLYQSHGFPLELSLEILKQEGEELSRQERKVFEEEFEKHKELSRTASKGIFKGGLADKSENTVRLHTATHLLHTALRKVLGKNVTQKGSNITPERLRFDFTHPRKLTEGEIKKIEDLINKKVKEDLLVSFEEKPLDEALKEGALAFFGEKYANRIKVYTIGDPKGDWFSKEVCGGPHVASTGEVGRVRIGKQEKIGANLMRIYATVSD